MYNLIQSKKANLKNKKGFTLVEVIVVLVILAILAAILIPSMIKYIDKAEQKAAIAEARSVLLAAQTIASEDYKTNDVDTKLKEVTDLAEVKLDSVTELKEADNKITGFVYTNEKSTVTYSSTAAEKFTIAEK